MRSHLTSRRGARVALILAILVAAAVMGALRGAEAPATSATAPASSESGRVAAQLTQMPDSDIQPVLVVATRSDGGPLMPADLSALARLTQSLPVVEGHPVGPPAPSADRAAAVVQVPLRVTASNTDNAPAVDAVRDAVAAGRPAGLDIAVTGGPAFGADIAQAFEGADLSLLMVTIGIVALLLLLTYRSPVLWLVPLTVVGVADQVAARVTAALGERFDWQFDAGVVSVLVFGAGTNYALLLISRYREELRRTPDHRRALADAWQASLPAILASNLTVVLALATLTLATLPGTRGLGVTAAVGLLVALAAAALALPAALAMCGRKVFWPLIPRPGDATHDHGGWGRIARAVVGRPVPAVLASLALLGLMATGLSGTGVGLSQVDRFRVASESAAGLETLARHFPAGIAQPLIVTTAPERVGEVTRALAAVDGIQAVRPGRATADLATLSVVTDADPGTDRAGDLVREVRSVAHTVPGTLVGGAQASEVDTRDAAAADLRLAAPLILLVGAVVLLVLLRSLVAPLVLIVVNAASSLAAIGAGSWLGRVLFDFPALDTTVPLFAFLFLVALGIDYTIFLVHRARAEAETRGTREGMVRGVARTGGVITSAGLVLAAVFAALGMLPLVTLAQLGLIVGLGVIVDTFVVRTVLVPGLVTLLGDRFWWPRPPGRGDSRGAAPTSPPSDELANRQLVDV